MLHCNLPKMDKSRPLIVRMWERAESAHLGIILIKHIVSHLNQATESHYLLHYKGIVNSFMCHEFTMCPLFDENTLLKGSNNISCPDCRESVSNYNGGAPSPGLQRRIKKKRIEKKKEKNKGLI